MIDLLEEVGELFADGIKLVRAALRKGSVSDAQAILRDVRQRLLSEAARIDAERAEDFAEADAIVADK